MKRLIFKTDLQNEIDYYLQNENKSDNVKVLDISEHEGSSVSTILLGIKQVESHLFETLTLTIIHNELYSVTGEITLSDIEFFKNIINSYYSN